MFVTCPTMLTTFEAACRHNNLKVDKDGIDEVVVARALDIILSQNKVLNYKIYADF